MQIFGFYLFKCLLSLADGKRKPYSTKVLLREASPAYIPRNWGRVTWDSSIMVKKSGLSVPHVGLRGKSPKSDMGDIFGKYESKVSGGLPSRSEEHTSELQSQSNLVCRLLLEKK